MAALAQQTITIVDKSNKVVSTSKQLKGVFAEAKYAYQARKAEIKAEKKRREEVELAKAIRAVSIQEDEARSQISSASRSRRHERPREIEDGSSRVQAQPRSLGEFNQELYGAPLATITPDPNQMLQRRQTDRDYPSARRNSPPTEQLQRSYSADDVDLNLAYGEFYDSDPSPSDQDPQTRSVPDNLAVVKQEKELSSLVLKCKMLLEEADCAGQSVKAIVTHLQQNPDAMAAVALTLAEISNIASKMAPGALTALKGSAPAVMALLASPEFLVAVGVGIGVTVVMFGGYKIIKKIKATATGETSEAPMLETPIGAPRGDIGQGSELLDVKELDRIEKWRRGIADSPDAETESVVSGYSNPTSVEGEFITPFAAQSMGHLPLPKDKSKKSSSRKDKDKDGKERKRHSRRHKDSDSGSQSDGSGRKRSESKELIKIKKPSPLRRMFTVTGVESTGTGFER